MTLTMRVTVDTGPGRLRLESLRALRTGRETIKVALMWTPEVGG